MKLPPYADLHLLPENARIQLIGRCVAVDKLTVALLLEDDAKKIARYKKKLLAAHPGLIDFEQKPGLTPSTVVISVKPKAPQNVEGN